MKEFPNKISSDTIAARSALLDYYSDKAAAFGGFFLASIFGLISMLAIVQGISCNHHPTPGVLIGIILVILCGFGYLVRYLLPKPRELQKTKYFLIYFFAAIIFLSFLLLLILGFQTSRLYLEDALVGVSFLPMLAFSYTGYYILKRFNYYANIADILEHGNSTEQGGGLRFNAHLDQVLYYDKETGDDEPPNLKAFMKEEFKEQKKLLGKKIIEDRTLLVIAYWSLILLLAALVYGMHFIS